jgi:hypothetical protein
LGPRRVDPVALPLAEGSIANPQSLCGLRLADGLVEDVLNHYGTKDSVVPLAHATIWDSGPSGCRGFDGDQVINVRAKAYGHSDLFSIKKCVVNGQHFQNCTGVAGETRNLDYSYKRYWQPFLILPPQELGGIPDRAEPRPMWRQLPWPLRGTVFPFIALPFIVSLIALLVGSLGRGLWKLWGPITTVASISGAGLAMLLSVTAIVGLWRFVRRRSSGP